MERVVGGLTRLFGGDDEWSGGDYALAIVLGERDDARLIAAGRALVASAEVVLDHDTRLEAVAEQRAFEGRVAIPVGSDTGRHVACRLAPLRQSDVTPGAPDWIILAVPLGSLSRVEPRIGGYPFESGERLVASLAWRRPIDEWFAQVAREVFAAVPSRHALIGHEVVGEQLATGETRHWAQLVSVGAELRYEPATR